MDLELSRKQFRRLLDMVYIGNWILNSTRGEDRIPDYDEVESLLFAKAREEGMGILAEDYQLIFVLNANRPEVRTPEAAVAYLRAIEATTGLTCSGIVNNTHLCGETTPAEIRKGAALAEEVSRQTGLPVLCHTAEKRFLQDVSDLGGPVFPITINMKKPWER